MQTARHLQSTPELDRQELDWWQKFAEVEEKYCWVQTPAIQRFLRKYYIQQILSAARPESHIAELGCGVGWLSILLAQSGAVDVVGIDFSPAQIQLANEAAGKAGIGKKIRLRVASAAELKSTTERYDLLVMHAFLHHLSVSEIQDAIATARHLITDEGRLFLFEPVVYSQPTSAKTAKCLRWLNRMQNFSLRLKRMGLRRFNEQEKQLREFIDQRSVGISPFGPSPKEIPFQPDEIPGLLQGNFTIQRRTRAMISSHLVAQQLLLTELTHPRFTRLVRWPILWFSRYFERHILRGELPPPNVWVFELLECVPIKRP
jgi:2-polyprenyl-3-methyl-5-hydroxy-6-metoxy-1,4-benzoquinol methylase